MMAGNEQVFDDRYSNLSYEGYTWADESLLFSEENYRILEEIFEKVELDLKRFVYYIRDENLLHAISDASILFIYEEHLDSFPQGVEFGYRLVVSHGQIISEISSPHLVELFIYNDNIKSVLEDISEKDIIGSIFFSVTTDVWISFGIKTQHTRNLQGNYHNAVNYFTYVEEPSIDMEKHEFRQLSEGWYMQITPPPG